MRASSQRLGRDGPAEGGDRVTALGVEAGPIGQDQGRCMDDDGGLGSLHRWISASRPHAAGDIVGDPDIFLGWHMGQIGLQHL